MISVLGQTSVLEKQFSDDVCQQTDYFPATLDGAPVVMIETPGLDGQGLSFSKIKIELASSLKSVDKVPIVIKIKRLEPTESKEIQNVMEYLNFKENCENICFIINNMEDMQMTEQNANENIRVCMSLLGTGDYDRFEENQNSSTAKVLYIPNKKDVSFTHQTKKLGAFISCQTTPKQIRMEHPKNITSLRSSIFVAFLMAMILLYVVNTGSIENKNISEIIQTIKTKDENNEKVINQL